jgi:phage gp36-like protein
VAYATNGDIEARLGTATYLQLADDDGNGVADAAVVDEARLAAEGEVNSYLAARYAVPVNVAVHAEVAGLLKSLTLDLAEYRLRSRRLPAPEDAVRRRRETIEWLERLAEGVVELPTLAPVSTNAARGKLAAASGAKRVLSRDELSQH